MSKWPQGYINYCKNTSIAIAWRSNIPWILHWDSSLASFGVKPTVQRSRSPRIVPRAPPPTLSWTGVWWRATFLVPSKCVSFSGYPFKTISKNQTNYVCWGKCPHCCCFNDMLWKINKILWFVFWLRVRVLWFHANSEAKVNERTLIDRLSGCESSHLLPLLKNVTRPTVGPLD